MQTVFEAAGGNEGLRRLADAWHRQAVQAERLAERLSPLFDGESRRESDLDGGLAVIWFIALADGSRRLLPGNGEW
jgi:hypothetical protein